jgi:hypothetical protein
MTITADSVVVDLAAPDMSRGKFVASLDGTPARFDADISYDRILARRGSHAFCRSIFTHESSDGTQGICKKYDTKSPGNTRSSRNGKGHVITTEKGPYTKYDHWDEGFDDVAWRISDPSYVYAQEGRRTIRQIIERFAPSSDGNAPAQYVNAVVAQMNTLVEEAPVPSPPTNRPLHVALSAGHHNTSGGNALEVQQTGPLTVAIANACRARGFDVRVVQGNDGMDMYPGGLADVAAQVVRWDREGWTVDVFLEAHTEGAGGARGAFSIYPDWSGDLDVDVRDKIGPDIVNRLQASTEMPIRNIGPPNAPQGSMSERQTQVGSEGSRLGVFRVTEPLKVHASRLITEFGAHDNAADLAIFNSPGFLDHAGNAVADAFVAFYGSEQPQPPAADPNSRQFSTGHWIINIPEAPMLMFFDGNGGIDRLGLPLAGMRQDEDGVYRQLLENCEVESWPHGFGQHAGVHVRFGGLGQRYQRLLEDGTA